MHKCASINNINARKMYRLKTCNDNIFFKYQTTNISCSPMICATNNKPTTKRPLLLGHACISVKLTIFWRYKMLVHQFHENLQWSVLQVVTLNKKQQQNNNVSLFWIHNVTNAGLHYRVYQKKGL